MPTVLPVASFNGDKLNFADPDGFDGVRRLGAFHLAYPKGWDFNPGIVMAKSYYLDPNGGPEDDYRGYKSRDLGKSLLGYSQTGNDQDELLQLECRLWQEYLPSPVANLLWAMNNFNAKILCQLLLLTGVHTEDIDTIVGGMSANDALQYCIFNHFRSLDGNCLGLTPHKDSGFITTLYTIEPGLESLVEDEWIAYDPLEGHFTVVIGHSFEVLTARSSSPVSASYHRVRGLEVRPTTQEERFTFGCYIGPQWNQDLYQYGADGVLIPVESFLDFQKRKAAEMGYEFHPKVKIVID